MALDAANFISELSITDPPGTDPLSQGDDQIRTCKRSVFNSFAFIDKAVTKTADQMNLMAITNEANIFTATQTVTDSHWQINNIGSTAAGVRWQRDGLREWAFISDATDLRLDRFDALGAPLDVPWTVNYTTGVMSFLHVPTIAGAPLWIAGEIRQFVIAATPGANWFVADGTNGTTNLQDRWLVGAGAFAGAVGTNLNASLDAQASAGNTGSTAISEAQMPAHNHTVYMTNNGAGGITDVQLNATDNVFGGRRNDSSKQFAKSNGTRDVIGNAGSGAGHTHTSPAQDVIALNPTFTGSVQPVSVAVETYQYVP